VIRINRQTDYAIRVILALARHPEGTRLSTGEIQREMLIPPAFSQRIVAELARGGFITTYPGRDGGLQLARTADQINLRQIVEWFEGPIYVSDCLVAPGECPFDTKCPVQCRWVSVQAVIQKELEKVTFDQLAEEAKTTPCISTEEPDA